MVYSTGGGLEAAKLEKRTGLEVIQGGDTGSFGEGEEQMDLRDLGETLGRSWVFIYTQGNGNLYMLKGL